LNAQVKKGIDFQNKLSWSAALAEAKAGNKYIFLDAFTTWCGPCKMMDRNVYSDEKVGNALADFISIKVQMDVTTNDETFTKSWYEDAKKIATSAKINAYPCLLFYSPAGELVYKSVGFRNVESFLSLIKFASNPERKEFRRQLLAYQNGIKDYPKMAALSKTTKELLGDNSLAFVIAKDYKDNYLDKLSDKDFLKRDNIVFIHENGSARLLNVRDRFFYYCYYHPEIIDSLLSKGISEGYVKQIIRLDVMKPILFNGNNPITQTPNWKLIQKNLQSKYPKLTISDFILSEKITFYRKINNWNLYTKYKSEEIERHPPQPEGMKVFFSLNSPAWDVFSSCDSKVSLERALKWSELSIKIEKSQGMLLQYLDTKANLLYKLGKTQEAILLEQRALKLADQIADRDGEGKPLYSDEFQANILKMKKGEPTWGRVNNIEDKK